MPDGAAERIERERDYHDHRYAHNARAGAARFYAEGSPDRRFYAELLAKVRPGMRVLEYGCGTGSAAFELAGQGAVVVGIDISEVAVRQAIDKAASLPGAERLAFELMDAEKLAFPDASFDLVCGSGILHHLDVDAGMAEVARVLRPRGRAVFLEPLGHNPFVRLYRRLTPSMRTPDEHPLVRDDIAAMRRRFPTVRTQYFHLLDLAALPVQRTALGARAAKGLARVDRSLLSRFPRLGSYGWTVVTEVFADGDRAPR